PEPAQEASGNPGGMFHAVLHGEDGIHARAHRAAALDLVATVMPWIRSGHLQGQIEGLLRLDKKLDLSAAQELVTRLGLPEDYVRWVEQAEAREISGVAVSSGGWLFKQAGWLHPAGLARLLLGEARRYAGSQGRPLTSLWGETVLAISRRTHAHEQGGWAVETDRGIYEAPYLVLANANGLSSLLDKICDEHSVGQVPLSSIRGQISMLADDTLGRRSIPRIPVAGGGYALALPDGQALTGATTQHHDTDPTVRALDHRHNLSQATALGVLPRVPDLADIERVGQTSVLQGRTGWRAATPDRLPLVGALPISPARLAKSAPPVRLDQVRMIPRERTDRSGIFVLGGLGSRGITWSILASRLLTHWMSGTPCPLESDLRDALDPARFMAREHCKQTP
ncbi:MAG TPA: FAD-dependent 5-carboxymethylaminomethyl-2-thiouridine(34) oxidoreductase MnmC, partial [Aquabacterium sp.]|nr:FAD-dependent 5-carboxymethylaminomethyl-2-thiouridine(34) oxidoreductase MnmC [Aquabacterium sp.]